jgi:hypothetical protein
MFSITGGKGFQLTFPNGWTASVQWGAGNYCENYNVMEYENPFVLNPNLRKYESQTAEIAAWDRDGKWYSFGRYETVKGYVHTEDIPEFLAMVAGF